MAGAGAPLTSVADAKFAALISKFEDRISYWVAVPVVRLGLSFSPGAWLKPAVDTNAINPFFTRHFVPPPPPPPTTRTIEVTYQGFYQTGDSAKQAIFKLGDAFMAAPVGGKVATSLFVAEATTQALTLTNLAAQTNIVLLNAKKEIVIPIQ